MCLMWSGSQCVLAVSQFSPGVIIPLFSRAPGFCFVLVLTFFLGGNVLGG